MEKIMLWGILLDRENLRVKKKLGEWTIVPEVNVYSLWEEFTDASHLLLSSPRSLKVALPSPRPPLSLCLSVYVCVCVKDVVLVVVDVVVVCGAFNVRLCKEISRLLFFHFSLFSRR